MRRSNSKSRSLLGLIRQALSFRLFSAVLAGSLLGVFAFSQAAASVGLEIETFRPLGAGFFSQRTIQQETAVDITREPKERDPAKIAAIGRKGVTNAPLNTRALWLIGQSFDARGQEERARAVMEQAERISRRDGAVELWLGADNLKRNRIKPALRNFDLMIRTNARAAQIATPALAKLIEQPEGRRILAPYFRKTNPWLVDLMWSAASTLDKGAPLARTLLQQEGPLPDNDQLRSIYAYLMKKLIAEKSYELALQLYPRLPNADPRGLETLGPLSNGKLPEGYPPIIWNFTESESQGGDFVSSANGSTGIEVYAAPGTAGVAASKLASPEGGDTLSWKVDARTANPQSNAQWVVTCLLGASAGQKTESTNLMNSKIPVGAEQMMRLPRDCDMISFEITIAGGIGRESADIILTDLKVIRKDT